MHVSSYQDLTVWQKAMDLAETCYRLTATFPTEERFGMVSQIRRAAASIPANIAEGAGRNSRKEFFQFLSVTRGSLYELITLIMISSKRNYLSETAYKEFLEKTESINKMLSKLMSSLSKIINA